MNEMAQWRHGSQRARRQHISANHTTMPSTMVLRAGGVQGSDTLCPLWWRLSAGKAVRGSAPPRRASGGGQHVRVRVNWQAATTATAATPCAHSRVRYDLVHDVVLHSGQRAQPAKRSHRVDHAADALRHPGA
jgi:hypothetical protein